MRRYSAFFYRCNSFASLGIMCITTGTAVLVNVHGVCIILVVVGLIHHLAALSNGLV